MAEPSQVHLKVTTRTGVQTFDHHTAKSARHQAKRLAGQPHIIDIVLVDKRKNVTYNLFGDFGEW